MSSNAASWFYSEPERQSYLISERLNATFWQARIVGLYWRVLKAEPPFQAAGYAGTHKLELEWVPGQWMSLKVPASAADATLPSGVTVDQLVDSISKRVLALPASISYGDAQGHKVYEWHTDGGKHRWSELQGHPEFRRPTRLTKK